MLLLKPQFSRQAPSGLHAAQVAMSCVSLWEALYMRPTLSGSAAAAPPWLEQAQWRGVQASLAMLLTQCAEAVYRLSTRKGALETQCAALVVVVGKVFFGIEPCASLEQGAFCAATTAAWRACQGYLPAPPLSGLLLSPPPLQGARSQ